LSKGLVLLFTGAGKGKTTAALGTALRAAGHGKASLVIQFLKGRLPSGEQEALKGRFPKIEIVLLPHIQKNDERPGFIKLKGKDISMRKRQEVQRAWELARKKTLSGAYDLVVLDEVTHLIKLGLVSLDEVLQLLQERPEGMDIILTGRDAPPELVSRADLVTEMREVKHYFQQGIKAKKGLDW
jgi:cob(I)alamin adenosyltransferase